MGHLPLFPDNIPAFREYLTWKDCQEPELLAERCRERGRAQGAEHGGDTAAGEGACLLCSLSSPTPPAGHTQPALSSTSRKLCTVLRLRVEGKERISEEAAYHPCYVWQSVTSVQLPSLLHKHKCSAVLWLHYSHLEHAIQTVSACRRLSAWLYPWLSSVIIPQGSNWSTLPGYIERSRPVTMLYFLQGCLCDTTPLLLLWKDFLSFLSDLICGSGYWDGHWDVVSGTRPCSFTSTTRRVKRQALL